MSSHPTMRAAVLDAYGAPFRLAVIARPAPVSGQVLVRITASGVNPLDTKIHAGAANHAGQPAHLNMREASVMPLVFITAWEGLVDRMAVCAGQAVLVLGGAGGVGRMAIQIARAREAKVFATGALSDRPAIEQLGGYFIDRS